MICDFAYDFAVEIFKLRNFSSGWGKVFWMEKGGVKFSAPINLSTYGGEMDGDNPDGFITGIGVNDFLEKEGYNPEGLNDEDGIEAIQMAIAKDPSAWAKFY